MRFYIHLIKIKTHCYFDTMNGKGFFFYFETPDFFSRYCTAPVATFFTDLLSRYTIKPLCVLLSWCGRHIRLRYSLEDFDQLTDHKPWKVIFIGTKVIISSLHLKANLLTLHKKIVPLNPESKGNCWCLVLRFCSMIHLHIKHKYAHTVCELHLLPCKIRVVTSGPMQLYTLAFLCSKTLNNISSQPLQAPGSITVWGCERSEWRSSDTSGPWGLLWALPGTTNQHRSHSSLLLFVFSTAQGQNEALTS